MCPCPIKYFKLNNGNEMYKIPEYFKVEVNINFDLNQLALKMLKRLPIKFIEEEDALLQLFNIKNKYISKKPRKVLITKEIEVPEKIESGYRKLIQNIELGEDLNIYLSTFSKSASYKDNLFNMDGLVHFHLGSKIETKKRSRAKGFIERTGLILIAKVTDENVYFLSIEPHYNTDFEEDELPKEITQQDITFHNDKYIKVLAENFPNTVTFLGKANDSDIKSHNELGVFDKVNLRKKNANLDIITKNNEKIISNVVNTSGVDAKDIARIHMHKRIIQEDIKNIKNYIISQEDKNQIDISKQYFIKTIFFKIERIYQIYAIYEENILFAKAIMTEEKMIIIHYNKEAQRTARIEKEKNENLEQRLISDLGSLIPIYTI